MIHPQAMYMRNLALHHLLSNGSSAVNGCRQNESKQLIKHCINLQVINVKQKAVFLINKSIIKMFFYIKPLQSFIHNNKNEKPCHHLLTLMLFQPCMNIKRFLTILFYIPLKKETDTGLKWYCWVNDDSINIFVWTVPLNLTKHF